MAVDLGLVTIFQSIYEFSGSVTLAGGASTTKTFSAENVTDAFESYVSIDKRISTSIEIVEPNIVVIFKNESSTQISTSFDLRIGFSGV